MRVLFCAVSVGNPFLLHRRGYDATRVFLVCGEYEVLVRNDGRSKKVGGKSTIAAGLTADDDNDGERAGKKNKPAGRCADSRAPTVDGLDVMVQKKKSDEVPRDDRPLHSWSVGSSW